MNLKVLTVVLTLLVYRNPAYTTKLQQDDIYESLPEFERFGSFREQKSKFLGKFHSVYQAPNVSIYKEFFGRDSDLDKQSLYHSWETAWTNGKRRATIIKIRQNNSTKKPFSELSQDNIAYQENITTSHRRVRRQIYGDDNRHYIPAKVFANKFPFTSVVKVSTGCTGALISPRHVITAAHCLHDQKDYVPGFRFLRVGLINANSAFEWIKVRSVRIPLGWKVGGDVAPHFDYALMRLEEKQDRSFLPLTISEDTVHGRGDRIHFTAFEDDKPWNTMWYRYCRVEYDSAHVLYHYCDAKPGSSGSGVYVWEFDRKTRVWDRKLIGVFSGNRWLYFPEWYIPPQNFNAAIRITSLKYVQICKWMGHAGSKVCDKKHFPPEPTPTISIMDSMSSTTYTVTPSLTSSIINRQASATDENVNMQSISKQVNISKTSEAAPASINRIASVQDRVKPSSDIKSMSSREEKRNTRRRNKKARRKQLDDAT